MINILDEMVLFSGEEMRGKYEEFVDSIIEKKNSNPVIMYGITKKGYNVLQRVAQHLGKKGIAVTENPAEFEHYLNHNLLVMGSSPLDIALYRDDTNVESSGQVRPHSINSSSFDIDDRDVFLIDDVIYGGRSARAAMAAISDMGRPANIRFFSLVNRAGRELPIQPDHPDVISVGKEYKVKIEFGLDKYGTLDRVILQQNVSN